jgi:predicted amidohydrolase YtcJ
MPGFTDTHLHPKPMAPNDIAVQSAHSVAEVQDMLRKKAAQLGPGKWITGYGWQESNLAEKRNLTRADLDAATPDNPVMLVRAGAHSAVSNSAALKIAKIDRTTPDPKSGLIEHDAAGEPNGSSANASIWSAHSSPRPAGNRCARPISAGSRTSSRSASPAFMTPAARSTTNPSARAARPAPIPAPRGPAPT